MNQNILQTNNNNNRYHKRYFDAKKKCTYFLWYLFSQKYIEPNDIQKVKSLIRYLCTSYDEYKINNFSELRDLIFNQEYLINRIESEQSIQELEDIINIAEISQQNNSSLSNLRGGRNRLNSLIIFNDTFANRFINGIREDLNNNQDLLTSQNLRELFIDSPDENILRIGQNLNRILIGNNNNLVSQNNSLNTETLRTNIVAFSLQIRIFLNLNTQYGIGMHEYNDEQHTNENINNEQDNLQLTYLPTESNELSIFDMRPSPYFNQINTYSYTNIPFMMFPIQLSEEGQFLSFRRVGLSKENIEKYSEIIPTDVNFTCCICMIEHIPNKIIKIRKLDCNHRFCIECIDDWFEEHITCPICRVEFTE